MCSVYRARDVRFGREVAIKVLSEEADADRRERLLAEARVSSGLRHENLIQVLDFGEEQGWLYLVMELVDGRTLASALASGSVASLERKLEIAREVASVLAYIHDHRIIHRDVKPANIYLDREGRVKLMDFGIAKFEGLQLTAAGFTLGTPYYMAPEQVRGEGLTHSIDIYAFGITLYEMLTGKRPFDGPRVDQVFDAILRKPVELGPLLEVGVPAGIVELIAQCTAKAVEARPGCFREVLGKLG